MDAAQLPNELLYKVILSSLADAIYSIGTSKACNWDMNILVTFYCVSIPFRAISKEIVCKAFDIHRLRLLADDARALSVAQNLLRCLRDTANRLQNPSNVFDLDLPAPPVADPLFNSSPLFVSYVLYQSSISLRQTAALSTAQAFQRTHTTIATSLTQSLALCERVLPLPFTEHLYTGILHELDLSHCGSALVQAFNELKDHAYYMRILQPSVGEDGTGPVTAIRSMIHASLSKIERTCQKYPDIVLQKESLARLNLFQLPGVLIGMRQISSLEFTEDEYGLQERLRSINCLWIDSCPFFTKRLSRWVAAASITMDTRGLYYFDVLQLVSPASIWGLTGESDEGKISAYVFDPSGKASGRRFSGNPNPSLVGLAVSSSDSIGLGLPLFRRGGQHLQKRDTMVDRRQPSFIQSLIAGGAAGTSVDLLFFPIDTVKTRLQSPQGFVHAGGFKGIYKGIGSVVVGSAPGAAVFFATYDTMKKNLPIHGPLNHMVAASFGEVAACLVRVPTEVIKTRMQTSSYGIEGRSSLASAQLVLANNGWRGFYRGFGITVMREIPFTSIQFPLYEFFKAATARRLGHDKLPAYEAAVCGSAAGGVAAALTTPLDVLKTRIMLDTRNPSLGTTPTILNRFKTIYATEGRKALFSGIVPRTLWISAGGAVFLGMYEFTMGNLLLR